MKFFSHLAAVMLTLFGGSSFAQTYVQANKISTNILNTGVQIEANYPSCGGKAVSAQVYLISSTNIYESQCFLNSGWDLGPPPNSSPEVINPDYANKGFCHMRMPVDSLGTDQILLRLWRVTSDCTQYTYEIGQTGAGTYDDYYPLTGGLTAADYYYPKNIGSLITVQKANYGFRMDRNGGAFYEFYNLRATSGGVGFYTNSVASHMGEALQTAVRTDTQFMTGPCGSTTAQTFFNPTQTGNACSHNGTTGTGYNTGSGPTPSFTKCDGSLNNSCTSASTSVETGEHTMRNFTYAANYPGPLNSGDIVKLSQLVTATDHYAQVDLTVKNTGITTLQDAAIEIPTFYFKPDFRKYTIRRSGSIVDNVVPDRTGQYYLTNTDLGMDSDGWKHEDLRWVTWENVRGPANDVYTIAWFYKPGFIADVNLTGAKFAFQVLESNYFRSMKFNNNPRFNMRPDSQYVYNFRYVIFPYRYNDTINYNGTNMTVEAAIGLMKTAYEQ